jgi:hypothetical protein
MFDKASSHPLVQCPLSSFNYFVQTLARQFDLGQDFFPFRFPDIALWCQVALAQVTQDRVLEFLHAGEAPRQDNILAQVPKETLHQIQPRATRRREVEVKPGMLFQPAFDVWSLVRGVVVQNQVNVQFSGDFLIDRLEELNPFLMAVALSAMSENLASK